MFVVLMILKSKFYLHPQPLYLTLHLMVYDVLDDKKLNADETEPCRHSPGLPFSVNGPSSTHLFFFFLRCSFTLVTQAGVQWHDFRSL